MQEDSSNLAALKQMAATLTAGRFHSAGRLSTDLVSLIEQQITDSQQPVSEVPKEFKLKKHPAEDSARKLHTLLGKKEQAQAELQQLDKEQQELLPSHPLPPPERHRPTPEEAEAVRKIQQQQKKHEAEMELKSRQYEENLRKFREEERELLERQKREKNEERLKEVAVRIEEIRQRQEERSAKMEEERRRLAEIKQQKKLYERLDEQFRSSEQQEERKKEELKAALRQQKLLSFEDIKQHERKYEDIMRTQREERERKQGQLATTNSKRYYHSRIGLELLQQEERARQDEEIKKQQPKTLFERRADYAEQVRTQYRPPLREEKEEGEKGEKGEKEKEEEKLPRSVSVAEMHKLGNDYMRQVNEGVLRGSSVSKTIEKKEEEPFKYPDYLQGLKAQRKISSHKESRYLEQIDNLMKQPTLTQEQKFSQARLIAQRLEERKAGSNPQPLIESIHAKLHLLKQINPP